MPTFPLPLVRAPLPFGRNELASTKSEVQKVLTHFIETNVSDF